MLFDGCAAMMVVCAAMLFVSCAVMCGNAYAAMLFDGCAAMTVVCAAMLFVSCAVMFLRCNAFRWLCCDDFCTAMLFATAYT